MAGPKSKRGKKVLAVRQAILDQFNLEPQPNRDNALKAFRVLKKNLGERERF
jgi:hypothetical protein